MFPNLWCLLPVNSCYTQIIPLFPLCTSQFLIQIFCQAPKPTCTSSPVPSRWSPWWTPLQHLDQCGWPWGEPSPVPAQACCPSSTVPQRFHTSLILPPTRWWDKRGEVQQCRNHRMVKGKTLVHRGHFPHLIFWQTISKFSGHYNNASHTIFYWYFNCHSYFELTINKLPIPPKAFLHKILCLSSSLCWSTPFQYLHSFILFTGKPWNSLPSPVYHPPYCFHFFQKGSTKKHLLSLINDFWVLPLSPFCFVMKWYRSNYFYSHKMVFHMSSHERWSFIIQENLSTKSMPTSPLPFSCVLSHANSYEKKPECQAKQNPHKNACK